MRSLTLAFLLAAVPATAETLSQEIARSGLAPTEARLAALPSPSNEDLFALAGLRFLGGIEQALQLRWKTGVQADWSELPILRLPIPENPDAIPFQAADFTALIKNLDADIDQTASSLGIASATVRAAVAYYAEFTEEVDADADWSAEVEADERHRWEREQAAIA